MDCESIVPYTVFSHLLAQITPEMIEFIRQPINKYTITETD